MDVLYCLAKNASNVVSRADLIESVWKVEYGGDESLTRAISILRKTFTTGGVDETIIETIPKRGYRLAKSIKELETSQLHKSKSKKKASIDVETSPTILPSETPPARSSFIAIGITIILALGIFLGFRDLPILSAGNASPLTSETQVLRMIESGHLTVEEAKSLLETLTGLGSQQIVETLETGTDRQRDALRLIADRPTFEQGIEILESEATTAADWKLIAELAQSRSPKRSVEAAKKAIALAPGDYGSLSLLVKSQINSGDYADARRSHASLKAIAQTPVERLRAAVLEGDLAYKTSRAENAEIAIASLTETLESMEPLENLSLDPRALAPMNEARPTASEALATRGQLRFQTGEYAKIEPDLLRAVSLLETDLDKFQDRDLVKARKYLAIYHDIRARAKHRLNQLEDHHEAHEKAIAQYRAMADAGERSVIEALYVRLETLAREYGDLNKPDLAIRSMTESIERFESYASDFPDDQILKLRRFRLNATLAQLNGDIEKSHTTLLQGLNYLNKELLTEGDPKNLRKINMYISDSTVILRRFKDAPSEKIYQFYAVANQTFESFENQYGASENSTLEKFQNRLQKCVSIANFGDSAEDTRTCADSIIEDSQPEKHPNIKRDRLEIIKLKALNIIGWIEPKDIKAVATEGLELAKSLDQKGNLSTDEQVYIVVFENMLKAATTPPSK